MSLDTFFTTGHPWAWRIMGTTVMMVVALAVWWHDRRDEIRQTLCQKLAPGRRRRAAGQAEQQIRSFSRRSSSI